MAQHRRRQAFNVAKEVLFFAAGCLRHKVRREGGALPPSAVEGLWGRTLAHLARVRGTAPRPALLQLIIAAAAAARHGAAHRSARPAPAPWQGVL